MILIIKIRNIQKIQFYFNFNQQFQINQLKAKWANFSPQMYQLLSNIILDLFLQKMRSSHKNINEQLKQELLPRTDKYKEMQNNNEIPITTESLIVIPCLTKTLGFKTNQFKLNEKYLKGMIQEKAFNAYIRKANQIIEREIINKAKRENQPFFQTISLLLKVSIAICVCAFLVLALLVYVELSDSISNILEVVAVVLLSFTGFIAGMCPIFLYNSKYTSLNFECIIMDDLKRLEAEQNKVNISRKIYHLVWKVQPAFFWIELHINRAMLQKQHQQIKNE